MQGWEWRAKKSKIGNLGCAEWEWNVKNEGNTCSWARRTTRSAQTQLILPRPG